MTILGIDLGTTNSACAIWKNGQTQLIPNRIGKLLTPSVIGLDDNNEILIGETAKHRLITHPLKTTSIFKRYMGSQHDFSLNKRQFSAIELSALILKSLKEDAEKFLEEEITQAVISVPAYFNDVQRKATKQAGELAGLQVERLINEPTAAAMVYGLHESDENSQFIILDMGGGTFDVSIVETFSGVLEVHASSGDNFLGGEDFTQILVDNYLRENQLDSSKIGSTEQQLLYNTMNQVKHELSQKTEIVLEKVLPEQKNTWTIDRLRFESFIKPLLIRIQQPIEKTLRDSNIKPSDIDQVVLVGGATRMQAFRSLVSKMFRRMPTGNIDPDLVVAMGTAIQAGLKEKNQDLDDVVLTDVCPYTLGTGIINHNDTTGRQGNLFLPVIERNTTIPTSIETPLCTTADNQAELEIKVYQGESRLVKNNVELGQVNVKIPKAKAGEETVTLRYSYDMNGLLDIDVTIDSTGKKYSKTIINNTNVLSDKEIEASKSKLAKLKFHPRDQEQNRLLIARAEHLYESSLEDKRQYISQLLSEFEQVLEKQNSKEIEQAAKRIETILDDIEKDNLFT